MFLMYLLVQTTESSWLSKTYKKLENSAKKRISEGVAIAILGGLRHRRSVAHQEEASLHVKTDELPSPDTVREQL
uniref:Cecropin-P4 n=1 Tax=Ascaris suum TaxID=6253 RepID=CECP4_ASCSU|nr:RecName: Full=Cecropin-P4; Flags: Precursor [Ascaris suum]BAD89088.1 cecropin P4 [Ascaris suum]BAD89092.1 cecropin P4 [Ascaris suum]